jgi:hypothetical protein
MKLIEVERSKNENPDQHHLPMALKPRRPMPVRRH